MNLTVILATCRPTDLANTLDSLANCKLPSNFCQTIVIENGTPKPSLDDVIQNASADLKINYMHCPVGNKSYALNVAIQSLDENHLLFLTDDDVQFDPDIFTHYCDAAKNHQSGLVIGGTIVPDSDSPPEPEMLPFLARSMTGYPRFDQDLARPFFIGSNWAVFSDDVKRLGGFDPRFGPGSLFRSSGQESQMMRTMRDVGFEFIFLKPAVVYHKIEPHHYSVKFNKDRRYRNGIESAIAYRLNPAIKTKRFPRRIIADLFFCTAIYPFAAIFASKTFSYKMLFNSRYAIGFLRAWFFKIPDKNYLDDQ